MAHELKELSEKSGLTHIQMTEEDGWTDTAEYVGCCDCGLVHRTEFRVVDPLGRVIVFDEGFRIQTRWSRSEGETKLARETKGFVCGLNQRREG